MNTFNPKEYYNYINQGLFNEGYKRVHTTTPADYSHHLTDPDHYFFIFTYSKSNDQETNPSKVAFELKTNVPDIIIATDSDSDSQINQPIASGSKIDMNGTLQSRFNIGQDPYQVDLTVESTDCLAMYMFFGFEAAAVDVNIVEQSKVVFLDFGQTEQTLFTKGRFNYQVLYSSEDALSSSTAFYSGRENYLNLVCPFWKSSSSKSFQARVQIQQMSSFGFAHSKPPMA